MDTTDKVSIVIGRGAHDVKVFVDVDDQVEPCDDGDMPKVDDARRIQQFRLDDKFQETFDRWAADVEQRENGNLVIAHEEVVHQGTSLLIFWRIDPRRHIARRR